MAAYNLIATTTVGSGGAASIVFSDIPQTFTDLQIMFSLRSSNTDANTGNYDPLLYRLNSTTSGYTGRVLDGQNTSAYSGTLTTATSSAATGTWGRCTDAGVNNANSTANCFSSTTFYIPNYAGSTHKSISVDSAMEQNQAASWLELLALLWSNTAAITSMAFALQGGNFLQYSSASLYGIKNS